MRLSGLRVRIGNGTTLVSPSDAGLISRHHWYIDSQGYVAAHIGGKVTKLHRLLLSPGAGQVVDHINRNKLDNRRANLRLATSGQNNANRGSSKNKTCCPFKGVYAFPANKSNPWVASCKGKHLGYFASAEAAAWAYDVAAKKVFGRFAVTNNMGRPEVIKQRILLHRSKRKGATSLYKGVSYRADQKKKWLASVWLPPKTIGLGSYSTEKEAAVAYDTFVSKHFGKLAVLNFNQS